MRPLLASLTRDLARETMAVAVAHVEATDPALVWYDAAISVPDAPPSGQIFEYATDHDAQQLGWSVPISTSRRA